MTPRASLINVPRSTVSSRSSTIVSRADAFGGDAEGALTSRSSMIAGTPTNTSTLDKFRASASVMYDSALMEAAVLSRGDGSVPSAMASPRGSIIGSSGGGPSPSAASARSPTASTPSAAAARESVLSELGDFF